MGRRCRPGSTGPAHPARGAEASAHGARWRGQGRDAPGWRFSLLEGERIVHGLRGQQGHTEAHWGEALKERKPAGFIPAEQVRLCVVCDGAEWRGKHVQPLGPQARQVLASDHGAPSRQRVAQAQ
jgi:hypothetical protein